MSYLLGQREILAIVFSLFMIFVYLMVLGVCVLMYVFHGLSLYTVAKRRGIGRPWLAWIPIGDLWIIGCISDHYQLLAKGKTRKRRFLLLGMAIAAAACSLLFAICALVMPSFLDTVPVVFAAIFTPVYLALAITMFVFYYMAQYDFYRSCDPDHAVIFFVVGIFIDEIRPIFQFLCRNKDLGMPAEKKEQREESYCEVQNPLL